jgi:hypothetical protein
MELMLASSGGRILQRFVCRGSRVVRRWLESPGSDGASPYHPRDRGRGVPDGKGLMNRELGEVELTFGSFLKG